MKEDDKQPLPENDPRIPPIRTHHIPPDPSGPPQPATSKGLGFGAAATIVVIAGGAAYTLLSGQMNACRGATRSSRLVWEERQAEIDAEIAAEHATKNAEPTDGHSDHRP